MKTIGDAARFFLERHWVRTCIGPYVVTTAEVRPGAFETTVTWGDEGPEIADFGSGLAFEKGDAEADHEEICARIEQSVGQIRVPADPSPAA